VKNGGMERNGMELVGVGVGVLDGEISNDGK